LARFALYGGTFDPFHLGHLAVVRALREMAGMDEVLVIPTARSPHKLGSALSPGEWRYWVCLLGTLEEAHVRVERWELDRPPPSYAIETFEQARQARGAGHDWWWVVGADQLPGIATWHRIATLLEHLRIMVVPRDPWLEADGIIREVPEAWRSRFDVLAMPPVPISATEIRRKLAARQEVQDLVPRLTGLYLDRYHGSLPLPRPSLDRLDA